ncbi:MAG: zinc ABC transporter substrate-binding protein [Planctomycetes bacterium]|nr:zinc ABC transporter substrate-binding protein [Planctomycetota bacterium]
MNHLLTIILAFLAALSAPPRHGAAADDKIQILTTAPDLRDIAEKIGGDRIEAKSLLKGPEDPHFVDAKPSSKKLANGAEVFVLIGMSLEIGYEPLIVSDSRNPKIQPGAPGHIDASVNVRKLEVPTGVVDRGLGDVHPEGNPHYLLDPMNGKIVAETIFQALTTAAPQHKSEFEENYKKFCRTIDENMFGAKILKRFKADTLSELLADGKLKEFLAGRKSADDPNKTAESDLRGWAEAMLPYSGKSVAVYHKNFSYFAHRFNLDEAVALEPKPGIQPSSAHLVEVVKIMKSAQMKAVFYTTFQDRKPVDIVCEQTGATAVQFPHQVNALPDATDYVKMIDMIVKSAAKALAGT